MVSAIDRKNEQFLLDVPDVEGFSHLQDFTGQTEAGILHEEGMEGVVRGNLSLFVPIRCGEIKNIGAEPPENEKLSNC